MKLTLVVLFSLTLLCLLANQGQCQEQAAESNDEASKARTLTPLQERRAFARENRVLARQAARDNRILARENRILNTQTARLNRAHAVQTARENRALFAHAANLNRIHAAQEAKEKRAQALEERKDHTAHDTTLSLADWEKEIPNRAAALTSATANLAAKQEALRTASSALRDAQKKWANETAKDATHALQVARKELAEAVAAKNQAQINLHRGEANKKHAEVKARILPIAPKA